MARPKVTLLALLALLAGTAAAEPAADVPERKRALIAELLEISGAAVSADAVAQTFLDQLEPAFPAMVEQVLDEETALDEDRLRTLRAGLLDFDRFGDAFRARFAERIDLAQLFRTVYVPLYDRYFDEAELREIVAFYRSPAGRKTLVVMPELTHQGLEASLPLLQPRVFELVGEVLAEQRARLLR